MSVIKDGVSVSAPPPYCLPPFREAILRCERHPRTTKPLNMATGISIARYVEPAMGRHLFAP